MMTLNIGRRASFPVASFEEASAIYDRERAASYEGASTFPDGTITKGRRKVARVSYNARVWPVEASR
jgi:hypothetical protein